MCKNVQVALELGQVEGWNNSTAMDEKILDFHQRSIKDDSVEDSRNILSPTDYLSDHEQNGKNMDNKSHLRRSSMEMSILPETSEKTTSFEIKQQTTWLNHVLVLTLYRRQNLKSKKQDIWWEKNEQSMDSIASLNCL